MFQCVCFIFQAVVTFVSGRDFRRTVVFFWSQEYQELSPAWWPKMEVRSMDQPTYVHVDLNFVQQALLQVFLFIFKRSLKWLHSQNAAHLQTPQRSWLGTVTRRENYVLLNSYWLTSCLFNKENAEFGFLDTFFGFLVDSATIFAVQNVQNSIYCYVISGLKWCAALSPRIQELLCRFLLTVGPDGSDHSF